jgi:hypothetical protein
MKQIITLLFFLIPFFLLSQKLPDEMRITADGQQLMLGGHPTNGFYNEDEIRIIELIFPNDDFFEKLEAAGDNDILANIIIDGTAYDSVGVRFKGATSDFRNDSEKKSFNISMDAFIDGQDVEGYETLNLNGNYEDPSSIRELLYNHVGRYYTPALKTNFAQLYINGVYWGPYLNVQQLNGEYLKEWFMSNDGTRWRAINPDFTPGGNGGGGGPGGGPGGGGPGGGGPGGGGPGNGGGPGGGGAGFGRGLSTLNYLGTDIEDYKENYTLKRTEKDNPWEDLVEATDKLNNLVTDNHLYDNLKHYLDIDKALWFLAHEIIFTDSDGYISKGGMDYYVYWEAETGRIVPLEYDGNSVMQFMQTEVWTPFYRANEVDFPLANRLLASPELRQRYLAHFRVVLEDYFTPSYMDALIDKYAGQIRSSIQNDSKRLYEPQSFENEIINLKNHVRERRDFLLNNTELKADALMISEVTRQSESAPNADEAVIISAKISNNLGVDKVRLYYGEGLVGTFNRLEMKLQADGSYEGTIPAHAAGSYVRYYVEAIADNDSKTITYAPRGAEHDVYFYKINASAALTGTVVINEFMASNDVTVADQDGEFDDWIELYNTTDSEVDLTGHFLSDNIEKLDKYDIPDGTKIPAKGYLIIWADEDGKQEGLHANFKLSASGENIFLVNSDTMVIDEITFGEQKTDISFARSPNGVGDFVFKTPTFNGNNDDGTTSLESIDFKDNTLLVYPNPVISELTIENLNLSERKMEVKILDVYGRIVFDKVIDDSKMVLSTSNFQNGVYFVTLNNRIGKQIIIVK